MSQRSPKVEASHPSQLDLQHVTFDPGHVMAPVVTMADVVSSVGKQNIKEFAPGQYGIHVGRDRKLWHKWKDATGGWRKHESAGSAERRYTGRDVIVTMNNGSKRWMKEAWLEAPAASRNVTHIPMRYRASRVYRDGEWYRRNGVGWVLDG